MAREPLLIVDGYNVLHAWPEGKRAADGNLEAMRGRLADRIAEYEAVRGFHAILIFDGKGKQASARATGYAVETRFSSKGLSADHVIERLIVETRERTDEYLPITVVTSDRLIHALAMRERVAVTSAQEFVRELETIRTETAQYSAETRTPFRATFGEAARAARRQGKPPQK